MRWLACSALLWLIGVAQGDARAEVPPNADAGARLVATRIVTPAPHDVTLPAKVGLLEAGEDRELAFQVSGRVETLADEGQTVAGGELVAALDSELERARLRQAELRLVDARREHARMRGLRDADAASRKGLESADTAVQLRAAERDGFREELARRRLVAPFTGVVTETYVDADEIAAPGVPVALFMDLSELRLEVGVPGNEIARVEPGARAAVVVPALGPDPFEGRVERVARAAGNGRHLFEVEIRIPNATRTLRPGLGARARIVTESLASAVAIPLEAVVERDHERVVFFVVDDRAHAVSVANAVAQGDVLLLREAPSARHELVVRGQHELVEGARVRVDNTILAADPHADSTWTTQEISLDTRASR